MAIMPHLCDLRSMPLTWEDIAASVNYWSDGSSGDPLGR